MSEFIRSTQDYSTGVMHSFEPTGCLCPVMVVVIVVVVAAVCRVWDDHGERKMKSCNILSRFHSDMRQMLRFLAVMGGSRETGKVEVRKLQQEEREDNSNWPGGGRFDYTWSRFTATTTTTPTTATIEANSLMNWPSETFSHRARNSNFTASLPSSYGDVELSAFIWRWSWTRGRAKQLVTQCKNSNSTINVRCYATAVILFADSLEASLLYKLLLILVSLLIWLPAKLKAGYLEGCSVGPMLWHGHKKMGGARHLTSGRTLEVR